MRLQADVLRRVESRFAGVDPNPNPDPRSRQPFHRFCLARLHEIPEDLIGKDTNLLSPLSSVLELQLHRGQLDEARELLGRYDKFAHSVDIQTQGCYQAALAAVRLAEGNHKAALLAAEQAFATREALGVGAQHVKLGFLHALEAADALGDTKANDLLETVEALPVGLRPPLLEATARRFRAHLAGDDAGADRDFTAAAAKLRALELPFHVAVVQLEHAEWLNRQGRYTDAGPFLPEARDVFERLGATPWMQRLDAAGASTPAETVA
jgi:hypothetical protein